MFNVDYHWDPLKVCIVGRSYSPKFYDYIINKDIRKVFYQIAEETEEDYQQLINLLESFGVEVLRPDVSDNHKDYVKNNIILPPPMTPRDYTAMIGNNFYVDRRDLRAVWDKIKGESWPAKPDDFSTIPEWILNEAEEVFQIWSKEDFAYNSICHYVKDKANIIYDKNINTANTLRLGKYLVFGTDSYNDPLDLLLEKYKKMFPGHQCKIINTGGHADGVYCAVAPGLIISTREIGDYNELFPGWTVVYAEHFSVENLPDFYKIKNQNSGKWWIPGAETNSELINFVNNYMSNWLGYVEESTFDVNMLIIDEHNVVCNSYNEKIFAALESRNIKPHVVDFRHKFFWDGGVHCITSDIHRLAKK